MRLPQLFVRVGRNRFAPVASVPVGKDAYMWDDELRQIVPAGPPCDEELRVLEAGVYTPVSGFAGNRLNKSQHK